MMENEVLKNIYTRRSIRSFLNKEVEDAKIKEILKSGIYAANGRGLQSPYFVVIKSEKYRKIISKMNASILHSDNDPYYNAPIIILVLGCPDVHTYVEDASCALENMMLAAHSLGLGSCWIHRVKEMFDSQEGKQLLKEWNIDSNLRGVGSLAIGYPKLINEPKKRKDDYYKIV